ncbi:AAA domain protein [Mycobacterium intracellulare 1956]|uniref:AAA domain protein n=1 Tax=Mycobacterium intracellulare 1956 TaxID=1299331 RepID=X8CPV5_MYCIT|nr:ATP-binding protein [Mycobacterium intracellulare]ASW84898.1 AAA family ATPase [Mycobacterium intracellulare]EUA26439.1 AAA domain protein [Mycobacterium intracellulare]EUA58422.1 AAA domain protein [Mycobacterium intracellulare 1956]
MSTAPAAPPRGSSNLDNLTLSRKEGWRAYVEAPKRIRPETLSRGQIRRLSEPAADIYNQRRADWHNNIGPLRTPQLAALHEDLWVITDSSTQDGNHAKGAVALDGYPGLGKTWAVEAFAKEFHRREVRRHGEFTRAGDERWPVCRIGMRGNTSMKDFNAALCDFYAHPGSRRGTAEELGRRALDCVLSCETRLLIIDDLHFLHWQRSGGVEISNHFKYIANEFPLTLLSIGIGLGNRGSLMEDLCCNLNSAGYKDIVLEQTTRRTTILKMLPYQVDTERGRRQWRTLLTTIEERLVLGSKRPGMLAEDLSDYLFRRSTGHIGSLMELIRRGCVKAIRNGAETLNQNVFDSIRIDSAAEKARQELAVAFRTRRAYQTVTIADAL